MNNKLIKFTFIFLLISIVDAQWESRTAFTIEKGRKEIGLLSPLRIGLQNGSELVINKFLLMPNISIKQGRPAFNQWSMAQRFQIEYPSLGMKWLQSPLGMELGDPNMFALISPEFNIPQMLSFYTEIIGTTGSITNGRLTLNGGIGFTEDPNIYIKSDTGYNAKMIPVFKVNRVGEEIAPEAVAPGDVIQVVDCVGKF